MPATANVTNPEAVQEALDRILKKPSNDERVARWIKKKAQGWLMQRSDCLITILPGSPLERDLPDWARRVREEQSGDLHHFAISHASEDILKHVGDFLTDLLDYEGRADAPELSTQAKKMLGALTHHDARDLYEKADEFYAALNNAAPRPASRSRRVIFASDNEDDTRDDVVCSPRDDGSNLVWREVMPRGLKTVAVVLKNCLGGKRYAAAVKAGQSQVWCLTRDVPLSEFSPENDILAAAEVDLQSGQLEEVKARSNGIARPYIDEIHELCAARGIDGSRELQSMGKTGIRLGLKHADHDVLFDDGDFQILASKESFYRATSPLLKCRTLSAGDILDGRFMGGELGEITLDEDTGRVALYLARDAFQDIIMDHAKSRALITVLKEAVGDHEIVGLHIPAVGDKDTKSYLSGFHPDKEPLFSPESDAILGEDRRLALWSDDIVHTASNDRLEMVVSASGVVGLYDLTENSHAGLSFGNPRIKAAARAAHAQNPGEEVSAARWKTLLAENAAAVPENQPRGYLGEIVSRRLDDIVSLDSSRDLTAMTAPPLSDMGFRGEVSCSGRLPALACYANSAIFTRRARAIHTAEDGSRLLLADLADGSKLYTVEYEDGTVAPLCEAYVGYETRVAEYNGYNRNMRRVPSLSHFVALAKDVRAAGFQFAEQKSENFVLTRGADGVPETFKNLGTDETPIIRLDKPKRFVGVLPGKDGRLESGRIAWTAMPPKNGTIDLQIIAKDGIEHLQRATRDRNWRIESAWHPFQADGILKEAGWRIDKGILIEMSNQNLDNMQNDTHVVSRGRFTSRGDDRTFLVSPKHMDGGAGLIIKPVDPKNGGTAKQAEISVQSEDFAKASMWQGGLELAVAVINDLGFELTDWNMQMLGISGEKPGAYEVRHADLLQPYEICDGFTARRAHGIDFRETYMQDTGPGLSSGDFELSEPRWTLYRDGHPHPVGAYGMHWSTPKVGIFEATSENLLAMAEMARLIEQGKIMDRPVTPEAEPAPENR